MRVLVVLFTCCLVFIALLFIQNNNITCSQNNDSAAFQNMYLISINEMSTIVGGCGGGTCNNYEHSCGPGCTHHNADKCSGTAGNCTNEYIVGICDCPGYYDFTFGCI